MKTKEEINKKLNKEYKNIGVISINEMHEDNISVWEIEYVQSIMDMVKPLKINEPIIIAKTWRNDKYNSYNLIDGYHRLKAKIDSNEKTIKAIILDDYRIDRKYSDNFFGFLSRLVGSKIRFISGNIIVVDGKYYEIKWNEGCGGCSNGWSDIKIIDDFINKDITVKTVESKDEDGDKYKLYINGQIVAEVDTGYGNGYYGGDFQIFVRN